MSDKNLKCYGMYVDSAEVLLNIPAGVMDKLLEVEKLVGVYQDPDGQRQVLIYEKKEQAKQAVSRAKELGFVSAVLCPTMIYVPESAVNGGKVDLKEKE